MGYQTKEAVVSDKSIISIKITDYLTLTKFRLNFFVVFSAVAGYLIAADSVFISDIILLAVGGYLLTGASNGFNQIWEKDLDKLMSRTANRPLADGRMSVTEAFIVSSAILIIGLSILFIQFNFLAGVLGLLAWFSYVFIYTPLKRISPVSVFVGAFPGAIPPLLGYVAYADSFGLEAGILFAIQFVWQFPHFWAIAWKADADYKKAGFKMLPSGEKNDTSAFLIFLYSLFMIPVGFLPYVFKFSGITSAIILTALAVLLILPAIRLYYTKSDKSALMVMFACFIYLPIALLTLYFDKI